jgi:hypothetical protein
MNAKPTSTPSHASAKSDPAPSPRGVANPVSSGAFCLDHRMITSAGAIQITSLT